MGKFFAVLLFVAVMLLVVSLVVPGHSGRMRISRVAGDMSLLSSALRMFKLNAGRYPTEEEGLRALIEKPASYPKDKQWQKIMSRLIPDPWNQPYQYVVIGDSAKMDQAPLWLFDGRGLYSFGPDGISNSDGNDPDDYNSWNESSLDRRTPFERWRDSSAAENTGIAIAAVMVCIGLVRAWHVRADG